MKIFRTADRPTRKGPADWFTGKVWIDDVVVGAEPSRVRALYVSFIPGARTAWHTHPVGQTLHVVSGIGRLQLQGEPIREIHPGDTVVIAPDEVHWHGAAPGHFMVHLAINEIDANGIDVHWLGPVSDTEYDAS